MLRKLVSGSDATKTRLHDQRGQMVPLGRLLRNGPRAALTSVTRAILDQRPSQPWISYDAAKVLEERLQPNSRVLEFGSGMSTLWYAKRAGEVMSIEDYEPWFNKVKGQISQEPNVTYRFEPTREGYIRPEPLGARGEGFDLIMVDGSHRDGCVDYAIQAVRPGGMIFLDNADRSHTSEKGGDAGEAREKLLEFAKRTKSQVKWFVDFAPAQAFVQGGLLVIVPGAE